MAVICNPDPKKSSFQIFLVYVCLIVRSFVLFPILLVTDEEVQRAEAALRDHELGHQVDLPDNSTQTGS